MNESEIILLLMEKLLTVLLSTVIYLYLVGCLLPRITMRVTARFKSRSPYCEGDRGLRRVVFPDGSAAQGRAVIYEPAPRMRRFLPRYALIKREGCTFIKCQIHEKALHVKYDVVTYNRRGKLLDVVGVEELVTERGYTRTVRLPRDTAYARVILRKVDGMYEDRSPVLGYRFAGMAILCGLATCATCILGILYYDSLTVVASLMGVGSAFPYLLGGLFVWLVSVGVALWMMLMYRRRRGKVLNS